MTIIAAPRLRLAETLLAERRLDEAERVLAPLADGQDVAALAALAALCAGQGRIEEAALRAAQALAFPGVPERLVVQLAGILARAQRYEAADAGLAAAIEDGDATFELRATRARIAEERGRSDLALQHWRRVLGAAPQHPEARLGIVRGLRGEGRYDEADAACGHAMMAVPADPRPKAEAARIALDRGDPVTAESRWHAALLAHPGHLGAVLGLGQALTAQHRFLEARGLLEELALRHSARDEPLTALVRTLMAEGDLAAAELRARELVARDPERIEHALQLGRVLEAGSDMDEAAALYRRLAMAQPQAVEPRLARAELAARQGDLATARAGFAAILERLPDQLRALLGLAAVMAELGEAELTEQTLAQAMAVAPSQCRVHLARASCAETLGQPDGARLALLEARSAMPWRVEPLLQLAQLALRQGRQDVAATQAQTLLATHPRHLPGRLTAFDALIGGEPETARALLAMLAEELPLHREVQRRLARLDWLDGAVDRARARCARISAHDPRLHGGLAPLARLDRNPLLLAEGEIRAFLLVRNEAVRLPWLLDHYRRIGVDRFLVLDNGSDDGTRELLLAQGADVHLFHTDASFSASAAGMSWTNQLLDAHGSGAWCLTVDADEALVYPHVETAPLRTLCRHLDQVGAEAMVAPMIDLYAGEGLDRVAYEPGQSLIEAFPWLDASGYVRRDASDFPYFRLQGGCRARLFYANPSLGPVLQKVPLIRWRPAIKYTSSKHTVFPCRLSGVSGALLHFKYLPDFAAQVATEVARGQHYLGAKEYRAYQRRLAGGQPLSFLGPDSTRYQGSAQLVELGLMRTTDAFDAHVRAQHRQ